MTKALLMHPEIYLVYDLKTADMFTPNEPERLMGPLNRADELVNQLKLMQKYKHGDIE